MESPAVQRAAGHAAKKRAASRSPAYAKSRNERRQPNVCSTCTVEAKSNRRTGRQSVPFVQHRVPEPGAVSARFLESPAPQFPADEKIEVAMGDKRGGALLLCLADQDVGGANGAVFCPPVALDFWMIADVPQDTRHNCPFRYLHAEEWNGGTGQRRFDE